MTSVAHRNFIYKEFNNSNEFTLCCQCPHNLWVELLRHKDDHYFSFDFNSMTFYSV